MPYLKLTENLKLQPSPGLFAYYDIQPGNGVGLFWDKHTHTHVYLLTYLPRTHTGQTSYAQSLLSCEKDGGHAIRSAVVKDPILHTNLVALSFIEPELWAIKVYIVE